MSEAKRRFFSGDTLRQALVQAANYHGVDPDAIAYRSIEKRHGFLKTRRKAMIEVDPEAPRRPAGSPPPRPEVVATPPAPSPAAAPARPAAPAPVAAVAPAAAVALAPPRPAPVQTARRPDDGQGLIALPERPLRTSERFPPATGPQAEAARKGIDLILSIAGLGLSANIHQGEDRLEIELSGAGSERCFDDEGELLMAIEHLLPRVIRSLSGETVLCRVDCDNFHEIREEQLRTLAQRAAEDVRRRGRPRTLEPMNPADRRVIHMTLADDPHVETESDGEGYFKRITIRPS